MSESEAPDRFELIAAIILGLAAIGTAVAGFQAGLWDGKMIEGYGRANKVATAAASEQSRAIVEMSKDASVDVQAMRLILEADTGSATTKELNYNIATYLYTKQMSEAGYKALGLPADAKKPEISGTTEEEAEAKIEGLKEEILEKAMEKDLADDENYRKEMLAKAVAQSAESDKAFNEGVEANEHGDKFELINVIFAISLFFTGISLVFKSSIRWSILIVGGLLFFVGAVYMAFIPWTAG
jgi:hypothetical protein